MSVLVEKDVGMRRILPTVALLNFQSQAAPVALVRDLDRSGRKVLRHLDEEPDNKALHARKLLPDQIWIAKDGGLAGAQLRVEKGGEVCQLHPSGLLHAEVMQQKGQTFLAVGEVTGLPRVRVDVKGSLPGGVLHVAEVDERPLEDIG